MGASSRDTSGHDRAEARVVADLMTEDLLALRPHDRVGRARDLISSMGMHSLLVMDPDDQVVGIVTAADLVEDWADDELVASVMSRSPLAIDPQSTLADAARTMLTHRVHHLVVEDETEAVGVLSTFDLLRALLPDEG